MCYRYCNRDNYPDSRDLDCILSFLEGGFKIARSKPCPPFLSILLWLLIPSHQYISPAFYLNLDYQRVKSLLRYLKDLGIIVKSYIIYYIKLTEQVLGLVNFAFMRKIQSSMPNNTLLNNFVNISIIDRFQPKVSITFIRAHIHRPQKRFLLEKSLRNVLVLDFQSTVLFAINTANP